MLTIGSAVSAKVAGLAGPMLQAGTDRQGADQHQQRPAQPQFPARPRRFAALPGTHDPPRRPAEQAGGQQAHRPGCRRKPLHSMATTSVGVFQVFDEEAVRPAVVFADEGRRGDLEQRQRADRPASSRRCSACARPATGACRRAAARAAAKGRASRESWITSTRTPCSSIVLQMPVAGDPLRTATASAPRATASAAAGRS